MLNSNELRKLNIDWKFLFTLLKNFLIEQTNPFNLKLIRSRLLIDVKPRVLHNILWKQEKKTVTDSRFNLQQNIDYHPTKIKQNSGSLLIPW